MTKARIAGLIFLLLAYIGLSFAAAWCLGDPHLVNRLGACLSAVGALLIIYQVRREVMFERKNKDDEFAVRDASISVSDRLRVETVREQRVTERHNERMRIITFIAILIFIGEVLHGWGDIALADALRHSH